MDGDEVSGKTADDMLTGDSGGIGRRMGICVETADDYRGDGWRARVDGDFVSGENADDYGGDGWRTREDGGLVSGKTADDILTGGSGGIGRRMGVSG